MLKQLTVKQASPSCVVIIGFRTDMALLRQDAQGIQATLGKRQKTGQVILYIQRILTVYILNLTGMQCQAAAQMLKQGLGLGRRAKRRHMPTSQSQQGPDSPSRQPESI